MEPTYVHTYILTFESTQPSEALKLSYVKESLSSMLKSRPFDLTQSIIRIYTHTFIISW